MLWLLLAPQLAAVRMSSSKIAMPGQNFIEERHATACEVIVGHIGIIGRDWLVWLVNPIPFSVVVVPDKTP